MASLNCEFSFGAVSSVSLKMAPQCRLLEANPQRDELRPENNWTTCQIGGFEAVKKYFQCRMTAPHFK